MGILFENVKVFNFLPHFPTYSHFVDNFTHQTGSQNQNTLPKPFKIKGSERNKVKCNKVGE